MNSSFRVRNKVRLILKELIGGVDIVFGVFGESVYFWDLLGVMWVERFDFKG